MDLSDNITGSRSYMNRLYPPVAILIQQEVEREISRLDYPGSIIYDAYPDREILLRSVYMVHDSIEEELMKLLHPDYGENAGDVRACRPLLTYFIQVVFLNEIEKRRSSGQRVISNL